MPNQLTDATMEAFNRAHKGKNLNVSDLYEIYKNNNTDVANNIIDQLIKNKNDAIKLNNQHQLMKDVTLNISDFKDLKMASNQEAIARMIHHVLITRPGTYPNNPDFGVGIERFLFELATNEFKSSLEALINKQISKWITDPIEDSDLNIESKINFLRSDNNEFITLALFFKVTDTNKNGNTASYDVNVYLTGNRTTKRTITKLDV